MKLEWSLWKIQKQEIKRKFHQILISANLWMYALHKNFFHQIKTLSHIGRIHIYIYIYRYVAEETYTLVLLENNSKSKTFLKIYL